MATRWGIVSTGKISLDFTTAVQLLPAAEHQVVAVAARTMDNAQEFANNFSIPKAYGSYKQLADDDDVCVVYIGAINTVHFSVCEMMIQAGKHVLCEKPLCMSVKETKELMALARSKKVFLMEAIWSRFFPAYKDIQKRISSDEIGTVVNILSTFGVPNAMVSRVSSKSMGGGVTLDMGIYGIQLALLAFKNQKPVKILAGGHLNAEGVDESTSVTLIFPGGGTATIITSSRSLCVNEAYIYGTKGYIKIEPPFWCPQALVCSSGRQEHPIIETDQPFSYENSQGLAYEAEAVRQCLQKGLLEHPDMNHAATINIAEIMEAVLKQIGVDHTQ